MKRTPFLVAALGISYLLAAAPSSASTPMAFRAPVRLTDLPGFGGFEPSAVVDRSGRVWVTAHKNYYADALSVDLKAPTAARAASWLWTTTDGVHFSNVPGATAAQEQNAFLGDEADLAVDDANNVYFTDLNIVSNSFSSWHVDPTSAAVTATYSTPVMPFAQTTTDRPFIAAAGNCTVLWTENQPQQDGLGTNSMDPTARVIGQQAVYFSHDGGRSLVSSLPHLVPNSTWCRPLIDKRNIKRFVLVCTDGAGGIFSHLSSDGGATWATHQISKDGLDSNAPQVADFPSIAQTPDGTMYALYDKLSFDDAKIDVGGQVQTANPTSAPQKGQLFLYASCNGGVTWTRRDITPAAGIWSQASLAASPTGRLGVQAYFRANAKSTWQFRAGTFAPWDRLATSEVSPGLVVAPAVETTPPGDFTQGVFGKDGKFRVVWNVETLTETEPVAADSGDKIASADIYYAQQR